MKRTADLLLLPAILVAMIVLLFLHCGSESPVNNENVPSDGSGTVTDIDGNVYRTVTIGSQVWMAENLKTTRLNDGTPLKTEATTYGWDQMHTPGYCWYDNNSANKDTYGGLYNWFAVNTGKLAPPGWRVPSDTDVTTLTDFLWGASVAGYQLRDMKSGLWGQGSDAYGFSAIPAGVRAMAMGFCELNTKAVWWTSKVAIDGGALDFGMNTMHPALSLGWASQCYGNSIRCVRIEPVQNVIVRPSIPVIRSAQAGDGYVTVTWDPAIRATSYNIYYRKSTSADTADPDIGDSACYNVTSGHKVTGLTRNSSYRFAVSAVNEGGETCMSKVLKATPLIGDVDGNLYTEVTIGKQTWMVENLRTTRFNDGTLIPSVTDIAIWRTMAIPGRCWYGNDSALSTRENYGALYNWYAVNTGKLAPEGWHVASDSDYAELITFLGGSLKAGERIKQPGIYYWSCADQPDTLESGFKALPGGYRNEQGTFIGQRVEGYFWSGTVFNGPNAQSLNLNCTDNALRLPALHNNGMSVRCVKNRLNKK